jgi:hypothetical protein
MDNRSPSVADRVGAVGPNKIARLRLGPRAARGGEAMHELVGEDDGVVGRVAILGCHADCATPRPLPTQPAAARRKRVAMGWQWSFGSFSHFS